MAALLVKLSNPPPNLSTSFLSSQRTSPFQVSTCQTSPPSLPALHSRLCLPRLESRRSPLAPATPRPQNRIPLRPRCVGSPDSPQAELGIFYSVFRELGFDVPEADMLSSVNQSLKSSSLDTIRTRVLNLLSLGLNRIEVHQLVSANPNVLTDEEIESFLSFATIDLRGKLDPFQLKTLLSLKSILGFESKVRVLLNNGVSNSEEQIIHVLNNVSLKKAFSKTVEEIERMVEFLKTYNGPTLIVKLPKLLHLDLDDQLAPRIKILLELSNGDEESIAKLLLKHPPILRYSENHIKSHIQFLKSFAGLTNDQVFKIFQVYPSIVSSSRERRLGPRIEFLKECGLSSYEIFKFLTRAPLFLSLSFETNIGVKLAFLVKLGFKYRTKELTVAMGSVCRTGCKHLQDVISIYLSSGLSYSEIVVMSNRHPSVLQYSVANLENKMKFLTEEMGRDVSELVTFPTFLGYRLDDRIKRRYEVSKMGRGTRTALSSLFSVSPDKFSGRGKQVDLELAESSIEK